jgi:beta-lactamase superfamily II metal-dependent hydrolase
MQAVGAASHWSKTSTNPEFLRAVTPRDAIISVGRHNTFVMRSSAVSKTRM